MKGLMSKTFFEDTASMYEKLMVRVEKYFLKCFFYDIQMENNLPVTEITDLVTAVGEIIRRTMIFDHNLKP